MKEEKKSKVIKGLKKCTVRTARYLSEHKVELYQIAFFAVLLSIPHATSFASDIGKDISTGLPWDTGINKVQTALTSEIPKVASGASIATGGMLWMFGQNDIAKTAMRATLGSGIVLGAPSAVQALVSSGSGCLF